MRKVPTPIPVRKRYYSLAETAGWASLGGSTVLRWVKLGKFPQPVRLGPNRVAWDVADLEKWAEARVPAGPDRAA